MKLQKATQFGLCAILELARNTRMPMSTTEIALSYGISSHHLAKVMRELGKAGLVESVRGVGGGYILSCNTKRVTLLDVIKIFEEIGGENLIVDVDGENDVKLSLKMVLSEIYDIAKATFSSITIDTLMRTIERNKKHKNYMSIS